jgi:hypothetical protein
MWEPRRLTTIWVSLTCYRDRFFYHNVTSSTSWTWTWRFICVRSVPINPKIRSFVVDNEMPTMEGALLPFFPFFFLFISVRILSPVYGISSDVWISHDSRVSVGICSMRSASWTPPEAPVLRTRSRFRFSWLAGTSSHKFRGSRKVWKPHWRSWCGGYRHCLVFRNILLTCWPRDRIIYSWLSSFLLAKCRDSALKQTTTFSWASFVIHNHAEIFFRNCTRMNKSNSEYFVDMVTTWSKLEDAGCYFPLTELNYK